MCDARRIHACAGVQVGDDWRRCGPLGPTTFLMLQSAYSMLTVCLQSDDSLMTVCLQSDDSLLTV
jgi:hypothetical protein